MKIKFVSLFLVLFVLSACNEWLDQLPPDGLIRDEFWKSKEDVEAVLMGAYESFSQMDELLFKYGEMRGDLVTGGANLPLSERQIMEGNIYSDNSLCNWNQFYKVINYCNEVLANAKKVQSIDNTFTDYQLQGYLSEATFLKGLSYFYLVRIFKDVPYVETPSESDESDFYIPKTDGYEILQKVLIDLEEMRNFAPADGLITIEENKGRASKAAFDALMADISLWEFDYNACLEYISRIEMEGTNGQMKYVLMPRILWFELFYPGNSIESIFEFQFDSKRGQNNGTAGLTSQYSYRYIPTQKAIELLGREFTLELYRGEGQTIRKIGEEQYMIWKYVGSLGDGQTLRPGSESNSCNWIVYRYADIILMKAEALSQLERFSEASEALNLIRERADVPALVIPESKIAFEDAILNERALELAFEGKRWFDLLRMGRRNNFERKERLIEIIITNVPSSQKRILSLKLSNPLGWYMPIYDNELERNKAMVQNPYYLN